MRSSGVRVLYATICVLAVAVASHAGLVIVDPDAYPSGTDISNAYPGVTLSAFGIYPVGPQVYALDDGIYSTSPNCFAEDDSMFGLYGGWGVGAGVDELFRADFSLPTN